MHAVFILLFLIGAETAQAGGVPVGFAFLVSRAGSLGFSTGKVLLQAPLAHNAVSLSASTAIFPVPKRLLSHGKPDFRRKGALCKPVGGNESRIEVRRAIVALTAERRRIPAIAWL
jgi:hypothetical protein